MPRDGSGHYSRPPGTDAITGTTISSTAYNANVADVEGDLNTPRPIVAGGTGASSADAALVALSGEKAKQVVTNYDMATWVNGSFYSAPGATSAPNPTNRFAGIYYGNADDSYATVEARDMTTGILYVRKKVAGVWDAVPAGWAAQAGAATNFVAKTGDTMTGPLNVNSDGNGAQLILTDTNAGATTPKKYLRADAGGNFSIVNNAFTTPILTLTDAGALTIPGMLSARASINQVGPGGAAVVNTQFQINGSADAGSLTYMSWQKGGTEKWQLGMDVGGSDQFNLYGNASGKLAFSFNAVTAAVTFGDAVTVTNGILTQGPGGAAPVVTATDTRGGGASIAMGANFNGLGGPGLYTTGAFPLSFGTNLTSRMTISAAGAVNCSGRITADSLQASLVGSPTTGSLILGNSGTRTLTWDGSSFVLAGGPLVVSGNSILGTGIVCRAGSIGTIRANVFNIDAPSGGVGALWIDGTNLGTINTTCDYRIKKDVIDLPDMWDTVKGLHPIKYTQAEFSPPSYLADQARNKAADPTYLGGPMFEADNIERWGFIAHELQETLVPTASTGVKDSPDHIQSPNLMPLVAALTKALQEAMTRIETLETRVATLPA